MKKPVEPVGGDLPATKPEWQPTPTWEQPPVYVKVRYVGPFTEVVSIIPGEEPTDNPTQVAAKRGDEITVTKHQASVLLSPYPNPNYEPADKAAQALVAAPAAEKE